MPIILDNATFDALSHFVKVMEKLQGKGVVFSKSFRILQLVVKHKIDSKDPFIISEDEEDHIG